MTQITQIFTNKFVLICVISVDKLSFTNLADFKSANQTYGLQVNSGLVRDEDIINKFRNWDLLR